VVACLGLSWGGEHERERERARASWKETERASEGGATEAGRLGHPGARSGLSCGVFSCTVQPKHDARMPRTMWISDFQSDDDVPVRGPREEKTGYVVL
jgi:hypothetical protein